MLDIAQTYSASFEDVSVSATQDLFEVLAAADESLVLLKAEFGQNSDFGDAEAEGQSIAIVRGEGTVTTGSGGTAPTVAPLQSGFAASGATVAANNTTKMVVGTGTLTTLYNSAFNVQIGWLYQPTPAEMIAISGGDRFTIELVGAPAEALIMSGTVIFGSIGG